MAFQQYNVYDGLTSCRLAATTNQAGTYYNGPLNNGVGATLTYASGALTIDGVTVNVGDAILLAGQTAANQNGIYVCNVAGSSGVQAVLQRRHDFQCIEQIKTGQFVTIGAGTANGGLVFAVVEPLPQAFGISDLNFATYQNAGGSSTSGDLASFSNSTGGLQDSGIASTAVQLKTNIKAGNSGAIGNGTATSNAVTVAGLTSSSVVVANILTSTSAVELISTNVGTGSFTVTLSATQAALTISYVAFIAAQ